MEYILESAVAEEIAEQAKAVLPDAKITIKANDTCLKLPDGSWSEIFTYYTVQVVVTSATTGQVSVRDIREKVDVKKELEGMITSHKKRIRKTRLAIKIEKEMESE